LKVFIALIFLASSLYLFKEEIWTEPSSTKTSNIDSTKKFNAPDKKSNPINIKRINTQLADAKPTNKKQVLKDFLIAKGIFDGSSPIDISDIKTLTFKELSNLELITVSHLPNLMELNIAGTRVSEIECLKSLQSLKHLDISNTTITNLRALRDLPLKSLLMKNCSVRNYSSIGKIKTLEHLDLSDSSIEDISSFKDLESLTKLDISNTKVSNLSAVIPLPNLKKLNYENSAVVIDSDNIELILRTR